MTRAWAGMPPATRRCRIFAGASIGETLGDTRFHFADAAAQGYVRSVADPTGELYVQASGVAKTITAVLHGIVLAFLLIRRRQWINERSVQKS